MINTGEKILVVDDFFTMRRIVKTTLKRLGYENILEAESGDMAQDLLKDESPFGLIVCDWNMPGMSGLDLLRWVRQNGQLRDLPFLMVTAEARRENILEAIQAGVTNYLVKPFNKQKLTEKIQAIAQPQAAHTHLGAEHEFIDRKIVDPLARTAGLRRAGAHQVSVFAVS